MVKLEKSVDDYYDTISAIKDRQHELKEQNSFKEYIKFLESHFFLWSEDAYMTNLLSKGSTEALIDEKFLNDYFNNKLVVYFIRSLAESLPQVILQIILEAYII